MFFFQKKSSLTRSSAKGLGMLTILQKIYILTKTPPTTTPCHTNASSQQQKPTTSNNVFNFFSKRSGFEKNSVLLLKVKQHVLPQVYYYDLNFCCHKTWKFLYFSSFLHHNPMNKLVSFFFRSLKKFLKIQNRDLRLIS